MRRVIAAIVLTIAGLVPLWRYHPATETQAGATTTQSTTTQPASSGASGQKTVDGSVVQTKFGPYQVQATLSGTQITDVKIITEPGDHKSQSIAQDAEPTLKQEALRAQSAKIDTVSGATLTSDAYAESLQAALDKAKS